MSNLADASQGTSSPQDTRKGHAKHSAYAEAADPSKYRVPDAPLFSCATHGSAAVLCSTAGKTGRNGRTAAIGATVMWLTCPHLNNLVARLERYGAVQVVAEFLSSHQQIMDRHTASHAVYESRVKSLLAEEQWDFFDSHFVNPTDAAKRKFGNAAVSHSTDMKCLHALLAQELGGAANPIGTVLFNYILFLYSLTSLSTSDEAAAIKKYMDSKETFKCFLEKFFADEEQQKIEMAVPTGAPESDTVVFEKIRDLTALQSMNPDICECSTQTFVFLEGKPPRVSQKSRLN